ncbi:hypothetical protein [Eisenbergiella porci]|nr:hypothetical protein [Eisenbergiella porci]
MSAGSLLFAGGILFLAAAIIETVYIRVVKKSDRKRLEKKMRERY